MALTQPYYNLQNLRCTLINGVVLNLVRMRIKRKPVYAKKWPGQSVVPFLVWIGEEVPEIMVEVYNDDAVTFGALIPNVAIDSFELDATNDENQTFLQSDFLTKFPPGKMVFGEIETELSGDKVSTVRIPILCNVLNPGITGGLPEAEEEGGA